jgi:1-deoxy-D-xylulose-5-phosphate reductoisomerase
MKKIAVLGITGSIGLSTVEVIKKHPDEFKIVLASSNNNYQKLFALAAELNIPQVVITNQELKNRISDLPANTEVFFGEDKLQDILQSVDCDIVLNAISGSAGLRSSLTVISRGLDLALANKESLLMAGHLISDLLQNSTTNLIPVDSEHSAILQALGFSPMEEVNSIILTASGGPFRELPLEEYKNITLEDTLKHPTWNMGPKVTIDSATMMNKGLEVIEAYWLFKKPYSQIKAVIHPQSIIHSFVEFTDGSLIAQMSFPNMQIPILFALSYPRHIESSIPKTNLLDLPPLTFFRIEKERYPLFFLACGVGKMGGILTTIMNAANEAAIDLFLDNKIKFIDIYKIIEKAVQNFTNVQNPGIDEIISTNKEIYIKTKQDFKKII